MRVHFLIGKEDFIDHINCIKDLGYIYWKKSKKIMEVGDIVFLFISDKRYNRVMYKLEVTNTDVARDDSKYYNKKFIPDNSCYKFEAISSYKGNGLTHEDLENHGISRFVQYKILNTEQADWLNRHFPTI